MSFQKEKLKGFSGLLLEVARDSIRHGVDSNELLTLSHNKLDPFLIQPQATFVTLHKDDQLRGCIGVLDPIRPLIDDVVYNAFQAAFNDPRFPPISSVELDGLHVSISILTPPRVLDVQSEEDLLKKLHPGRDGVILEHGIQRGTFLPSVWEDLSEPKDFIFHLKQKAGLPLYGWDSKIKVHTYESLTIK